MKVQNTKLPGVLLVEPVIHQDHRGFFLEAYHAKKYQEHGLPHEFVQDNRSYSVRGTLRGLHLQLTNPQGKLICVIEGEILDVAVDVRLGSPSFGKWDGVVLSGENCRQLYIPPGFAHGFCVMSEHAHVLYKCTDYYVPGDEVGIAWDDPDIAVQWPIDTPLLSEKDRNAMRLKDLADRLPKYRA